GDARALAPAGRPAPAVAVVLAARGHAAPPGDRVDGGRHRLPRPGGVGGAGLRARLTAAAGHPGPERGATDAPGAPAPLAGRGGGAGEADVVEVAGPRRAGRPGIARRPRHPQGPIPLPAAGDGGEVAAALPGVVPETAGTGRKGPRAERARGSSFRGRR